jgi:hypothetical protein
MDTNEGEGEWLVLLHGDNLELEKFAQFLLQYSPRYELLKPLGVYYFSASQFGQLNEPAAVLEKARNVFPKLKGFAKLTLNDVQSIEIGSAVIRKVGDTVELFTFDHIEICVKEASEIRDALSGQVISVHKEPEPSYPTHPNDLTDDPMISDALSYFSQDTSWLSLYKAYETILSDIDEKEHSAESKIVNKGWATKAELGSFRYSAEYYDFVGRAKDATGRHGGRHSVAEYKKKHKNDRRYTGSTMHLPEAEDLIRRLLIGWLEEKRLS